MRYSILLSCVLIAAQLGAKEPPVRGKTNLNSSGMKAMAELCAPATAQSDLNINNVRATILGGGDMWWDLNQARYEIPKGENKHSMFAGALWLGGVDEGNQLKLAAMTYRQKGNDFWTGPLSNDGTASTEKAICDKYDKHWLILRSDVEEHRAYLLCKDDPNCDENVTFPGYSIPQSILQWPGNGAEAELPYQLAPFIDRDGDQVYDPTVDYPAYDLDKAFDCRKKEVDLIYGDQTIWWVYNDRGNVHTETQAGALGFEIRAQAFAFSTNDEINNMTFNNYRILNKSTFRLTDTYFSTWFDPDLGNANDDIIGCDIPRGLGYCYNGDAEDEGAFGYGLNPPAVGFDFFQGPFADYFDGIDNDRDGCTDGIRDPNTGGCIAEDPTLGINERIIMSHFMYFNNASTTNIEPTTDPDNAAQFYNYMRAFWKNGNPLVIETPSGIGNTSNGDGFTADGTGVRTNYAYPGISYDTTGVSAPFAPINWYESPANLADKRGLHSAGPFSLAPGAINFITTGVVWARDFNSNDLFASVDKVIIADDKSQNLFDNCFQVLDGPTSPDLDVVELDRELIITFTNPQESNNYQLGYREFDPTIPRHVAAVGFASREDSLRYYNFTFEGYQLFQLSGPNVSISDIYDPEQARLVAQCDIKNGVTKIVNFTRDEIIEADIPQLMTVAYENEGIRHSFRILEDQFAQGNRRLVNHKEYYFTVVAYAHNDYSSYAAAPDGTEQKVPYLAGRLNNRVYQAIPHLTQPEQRGLILGSSYGDGVDLTRLEGMGNGGRQIELTSESIREIVTNFKADTYTYERGFAPVDLKVVDPKSVPSGDYILQFDGVTNDARWTIINENTGQIVAESDTSIRVLTEQIIPALGMSLSVENAVAPGGDEDGVRNNGVISGDIIYSNPQAPWLAFVPDGAGTDPFNWILAGGNTVPTAEPAQTYQDYEGDPLNFFGTIANNTWGPYAYASFLYAGFSNSTSGFGPAMDLSEATTARPNIADIHSVNIVFTNDKSLWTRVPVFEMGEDALLNQKGVAKWRQRREKSWDLIGNQMVRSTTDSGWSYFPGYAISVETGERLCMAFGENSWLIGQNGGDMLFNPSSTVIRSLGPFNNEIVMAGQHYLYVWAPRARIGTQTRNIVYTGDNPNDWPMKDWLDNPANVLFRTYMNRALMWCSIPLAVRGFEADPYTFMPSEITVKLRMDRPFGNFVTPEGQNNGNPRYSFSTRDIATKANDFVTAESALDLIRVVPNPYYGSSFYEDSQLDNIVKITNLPARCTITIFGVNGTQVRQIRKDNSLTFLEWDLRNDYSVPIASGVYIIHIDAGDIGEKVVKWFGAMRPVDLNAF